ncbi:MAG: cytochrome c3 family protein [Spirochaetota bacterium]|nr:cytochrome c3 family protein [Spirochaetota bacterium]
MSLTNVNSFVTELDIKNGIIKTSARMQPVVISHKKHEDAGVKCIECHIKEKNDSRIKTCAYCHKGIQGVKHLHKVCIKCHKEKKQGAVACNQCHLDDDKDYINKEMRIEYNRKDLYKKDICMMYDKAGVKCNECHHTSDNTDDKRGKEKKCSECHAGKSRMRIMHVFCKSCHMARKKGPISCDGCHK